MTDEFMWWPVTESHWSSDGWIIEKIYAHPHRKMIVTDNDSNAKVLDNWCLMFGSSGNSDNRVYVDSLHTDCDVIRINRSCDKEPLGELRRIVNS